VTSRKLGNRRFLKPGCDQLFRAARNDNQACKRGARRAGEVYTVRYDAVNAMLLNEFLKEHRKVEQQETTIAQLKSAVTKQEATATEQQKEIPDLTTSLKEQAFQIQKVSAQLEAIKPAPQVVNNP
jgi:septal ring factor EnvC (AmiA/AmiB activator)